MASLETELVDVMEPRRKKRDAMGFMTRHWRAQKSYRMERPLTPQQLKEEVASSLYMETAIREEAARSGETEAALRARLQQILKEMCLERKMYVTRALGIAFIKTALSMRVGVHVNERRIFQLKGEMGDNPVLFLPTHRSYADFCLMTYLCYHYDIELPAVAAGMDFYHMAGMGRVMRDTCAFYIPRSLAGARLHAHALRRYVRALLTQNPAPLEFFLEGARSRSNKSLAPKYGLLSMALLPLFTREVPDVTIVPINISYDRLMEQTLFAYEHLGVPKPKESMKGLLKTLSFLNDDFGNIYVSVGAPLSAKRFLGELPCGEASREPLELQELTNEQFALVQTLAEHVVAKQQECTVISTYNLVATALMQSLAAGGTLSRDQLLQEMEWLADILRTLGAQVMTGDDLAGSVARVMTVHRASVRWDRKERLRLVCPPPSPLHHHNSLNLKGHQLEPRTMRTAVPVIQLQLYVNPASAQLAPAAFLAAALPRDGTSLTFEELLVAYKSLRSLHKYEFVYCAALEDERMSKALQFCLERDVMRRAPEAAGYARGGDARLRGLLADLLRPSVDTLLAIIAVVKEHGVCEQRQLLRLTQQSVEACGDRHPYCLSLEAIRNLTQGLQHYGALALNTVTAQDGETKETQYSGCEGRLAEAERALLAAAPPSARTALTGNPVLLLDTLCQL